MALALTAYFCKLSLNRGAAAVQQETPVFPGEWQAYPNKRARESKEDGLISLARLSQYFQA
jgi:hypothetical protein